MVGIVRWSEYHGWYQNSVSAILKRELSNLIIVKCVSHSLHLCAEKAAKLLPRQLDLKLCTKQLIIIKIPKKLQRQTANRYQSNYTIIAKSNNKCYMYHGSTTL